MSERPDEGIPPKFRLRYEDHEDGQESIEEEQWLEVEVSSLPFPTLQDTRLIGLELREETRRRLAFSSGDVLLVQPRNLAESVTLAVSVLQLNDEQLDRKFRLEPALEGVRLPHTFLTGGTVTSLRRCLASLFDLQTLPKRSFFEVLGSLSKDATEKERLLELASPQGLDDFIDYSNRSRRTVAEALRDFPRTSASLSVPDLFSLFPWIRPRAFSIASAPSDAFLQILVAKVLSSSPITLQVEYKSRMSEPRRGLCSTFLSRLDPGHKIWVRVREGSFRFPPPSVPVVLIGPGTGIAPFRSFVRHRETEIPRAAPSLLFFGCRGPTKDFYFESEWPRLELCRLFTAFSRDGDKEYVQHVIQREAQLVWNVVTEQGGSVFVAGSAGEMPKGVAAALERVAEERGEDKWVEKLEKSGRLQYETY